MIDPRFPFESDDEYAHRVVLDKLHEGIELTEDEQKLLDSMVISGGIIDEEYEAKFLDAMRKWSNGEDLTPEEERLVLESINGGDNMMGATT